MCEDKYMPIYKNYKIKQNETLETIAQKQMGSQDYWPSLVRLNRLRPPFISDDPIDQLGPIQVELSLEDDLPAGSTQMSMLSYVNSQQISYSVLYKGAKIFLRTYNSFGISVHDELTIEKYYVNDFVEFTESGSIEIVPAGTLKFAKEYLGNPTEAIEHNNALFPDVSPDPNNGVLHLSSNTYTPLIYNYPVYNANITSSKNYYVKYSYTSKNGETMASPHVLAANGIERIPFTRQAHRLFSISPPDIWPDNVETINIYIGTDPNLLWYQFSFNENSEPFVESELGIIEAQIDTKYIHPKSSNTAFLGTQYNYYKGMNFTIHQNSASLKTVVLKTGDIIHLERVSAEDDVAIQNNFYSTNFVDTLGSDIMLDEYGMISFGEEGLGDFNVISGVKNVRQAVLGRMLTRVGDLNSFPAYGNPALDYLGEKYRIGYVNKIRTGVMQAVLQDTRISSIQNLEVNYNPQSSAVVINNFSIQVGSQGAEINFVPLPMNL